MTIKTEACTFDVDSTLADTSARHHLIDKFDRTKTDWSAYALACSTDTPTDTVDLLRLLSKSYIIVLVTARPEAARKVTEAWLDQYEIPYDYLVMDEGYHSSILDYKVSAVSKVSDTWPVKLHVDDWWGVGEAVKEHLGIPTVIVRSYAPTDLRATY